MTMADDLPPVMREEVGSGFGRQAYQQAAPQPGASSHPQTPAPGDSPAPPVERSAPAPDGAYASPRQAFAAIDLGTNNCRLLIARPHGAHFVVIDAFSRVVRLGEGLAQTGRLSDAAMERTMGALRVCADKLKRRNVHLARSVATEACRRAENGPEFIEQVRQETGVALDIISAKEEARLAVMGCHLLLEAGEGPAVIFDIGGGSTELILIDNRPGQPIRIRDWQSVPWGVVSLSETCGPEGPSPADRAARYTQMLDLVRTSLADFSDRIADARGETGPGCELRLLGTSGTVTTLASLHLGLPQYDRRAVDGLLVQSEDMAAICRDLGQMSPAERQAQPCIGRERSELVVAGCAILDTILELWPADRLGVADRGIREGILRSMMAAEGNAERSLAALRQARRDALLEQPA